MSLQIETTEKPRVLPTLDEARFESEVRRADNWIDAMVRTAGNSPRGEVTTVTPALATALLSRNESNRPLRETTVEHYARDIENGRFDFNGASLVVSTTGKLLDGQHRCEAVIKAKQPLLAMLVFGVADAARTTMDQGKVRKAGDYLSMMGYTNKNALAAAAAQLAAYLKEGRPITHGGLQPTKAEVIDTVLKHPGLVDVIQEAGVDRKSSRILASPAVMSFCYYVILMKTSQPVNVKIFFTSLIDGVGLLANDPILAARIRLIGQRSGTRAGAERAEIIFRAWNAYAKGENPKKIIATGKFPEIERVRS